MHASNPVQALTATNWMYSQILNGIQLSFNCSGRVTTRGASTLPVASMANVEEDCALSNANSRVNQK
jgi:hypothetical protein